MTISFFAQYNQKVFIIQVIDELYIIMFDIISIAMISNIIAHPLGVKADSHFIFTL